MSYRDDFVEIGIMEKPRGKSWVYVKTLSSDGEYLVSFHQLFEQIQLIVKCEREKYPNLPWEADIMVRNFLVYAATEGATWDHAAKYFKLPFD